MKCPVAYKINFFGHTFSRSLDGNRIAYWSDAERSGIKSMGDFWLEMKMFGPDHIVDGKATQRVIAQVIRNYVRAARETKG